MMRGSALGSRNLTHYIARSLLEAGEASFVSFDRGCS
jgi:hypothetical protein